MNILTALILSLTMSLGAGVKCSDAEMYFCDGFFGASLIETKIETVVYNSKDESEDREIPYGLPCYYYPGSYENTCANGKVITPSSTIAPYSSSAHSSMS